MTPARWDLDHFIFEEYRTPTAGLGIYRVLFAAYVLTYLPKHLWIANFPDSFFNPPLGFTVFFTGFPGLPFLFVVNSLAILSAICLLFGYRTRLASISFALLLFLCDAWGYSLGKIDHDITLIFIPLIMHFAGWGDGYSLDSRRRGGDYREQEKTIAWPLALMALVVGLAMMTAAVAKATTGWLDPHSHAVRAHMLNNVFVTGRANWFADRMLRIKSGVFWKLCDYGTVLIEAAFLLTVLRRRAFRIVCALACLFHLGIALTMQIAFVGNIIAYAAIADWSVPEAWASGLLRVWNGVLDRIFAPFVLALGAAVAFIYLRFGNPLQLPQSWEPLGTSLCVFSAAVATVFLLGLVRDWFRNWFSTSSGGVILFDGFCGLCNRWVDFVLTHDHRRLYRFTPLQSPAGKEILNRFDLPPDFTDSFVLVEAGRIYLRSSAFLRISWSLGFPYAMASACVFIPRVVRDAVYRFVAARRLSWFGSQNTCRVPTPEEAQRFL